MTAHNAQHGEIHEHNSARGLAQHGDPKEIQCSSDSQSQSEGGRKANQSIRKIAWLFAPEGRNQEAHKRRQQSGRAIRRPCPGGFELAGFRQQISFVPPSLLRLLRKRPNRKNSST